MNASDGSIGTPTTEKSLFEQGGDPLKDSHGFPVFTVDQFLEANEGKSFDEIINQRQVRNGLPGGPQMRMVLNPRDGNIMDMRHVMVVGFQYGTGIGYLFELSQKYRGVAQAFNGQDLYSNEIGAEFKVHWSKPEIFGYPWPRGDWSTEFHSWITKPK